MLRARPAEIRVTVPVIEDQPPRVPDVKGPSVHTLPRLPRFAALAFTLALVPAAVPAIAGDVSAPAFNVRTLEGKAVRLSDFRNRPVIVDFWATWCAPCRATVPHLNQLSERYGARGLTVLGVSVDETGTAPVKRFVTGNRVRYTVAMANDEMLDAYGPIRSIPTMVFISRRGEIVRRVVGYIDQETLDGYVQEILLP
jgi:thiol-disulfide isomerase/thioredoxin